MRFYFLLFIVFIGASSVVQAADKNTATLDEQQQRELAQLKEPMYKPLLERYTRSYCC